MVHSDQVALYVLAGIIVPSIGFLLWSLFQLLLETKYRGRLAAPPVAHFRWRR
jgi:hypothetical protein